jgi:hypothetical protein
MTIKASGQSLSFSEISAEFGFPPGRNLGAYRVSENVGSLTNLPLDTGIPQSGEIKFSDFYSKKLNIIVNLYSGLPTFRIDAKSMYDGNAVKVVGGFKSRPSSDSSEFANGKRVIINVNKLIGSEKTGRNYAALKTGTWNANTNLEIVVGSTGTIMGAGGDGGSGDQQDGFQGTSALGIQYPVTITNQGTIFAGRGGGGGGGPGNGYKHADTQRGCKGRQYCINASGGGGGGGRGYPGGIGGQVGTTPGSCRGMYVGPQVGGSGDIYGSGAGGAGGRAGQGRCVNEAVGTNGGGAESSGGGSAEGGSRGYAIIIDSTGSLISYVGNSADGDTVNGTVL